MNNGSQCAPGFAQRLQPLVMMQSVVKISVCRISFSLSTNYTYLNLYLGDEVAGREARRQRRAPAGSGTRTQLAPPPNDSGLDNDQPLHREDVPEPVDGARYLPPGNSRLLKSGKASHNAQDFSEEEIREIMDDPEAEADDHKDLSHSDDGKF